MCCEMCPKPFSHSELSRFAVLRSDINHQQAMAAWVN